MYNNKKDVDKHVQSLKSKLSVKEFLTRAFSIARLYYDVGEYANSKFYVEQYLSLKNNNAAAYKLLGQTYHKLGQKEMALDQYKTSLDIDATQTSLILDICEILADNETKIDPIQVKYWSDKAEATFPRHPITFKLRERLITKDNPNPETLIKLLQSEVTRRPKDCVLHIRLLKCYVQMNKTKEALEHSANLEFGEHPFLNSFDWYETLSEILEHKVDGVDWLYQLLLLTVKERICSLYLTEIFIETSKSILQSCNILFSYGKAIQAVSKAGIPLGFAEFHTNLIQHHRGQFALHTATLLLKKAKKNQLSWRSATTSASPLLLVALHTVPVDLKAKWVALAPLKQQNAVHRWFKEGSYRCSQSGHYILSNIIEKGHSSLDQISASCSDNHWKEKIFEKTFIFEENSGIDKTSDFFLEIVSNPVLRLPRSSEVQNYDADAQRLHPNSLHHFVWMLLNYKNYAHFKCTVFDMLTPKSYNYANCGPETLDRLDMLAFLFSATLAAQQYKSNQIVYDISHNPDILPANITDILCTLPQMKWWDCAYKFSQNELGTELTNIRATLSRGIEVIRCIDNHGLDAEFLCKLGHIFGECADLSTSVDEKKNFQIRACLYYNAAIPVLEKIKNHIAVELPANRMFNYVHKDFTKKDLNSLVDTSKLYVAITHHQDCEYEKVIEILSDVKLAKAYYYLADSYHKLALEDNNVSGDQLNNSDRKSKIVTLLNKAKYFATKSLDCIKNDEPNKDTILLSIIQELLEDIEMKLNGDVSGFVNEVDGRYSEYISLRENDISQQGKSHYARNMSSTPKHTLKVNLTNYRSAIDTEVQEKIENDNKRFEIIENQIKDLQKTCHEFMEQSKNWFEENPIVRMINCNIKTTTEQFKLLNISIDQVKYQVDECRNDCKGVNELKQQIADLRKELNKMKKSAAENTNDNNDLYNLEEEYRTNENTSRFTAQLPFTQPQVIPPFNPRFGIPPFPMPPNAYQLYGQSLYNLYNQYSQLTQSQQIPGVPPMFDSNRPHLNYPAMYPGSEQMYLDIAHLVPPTVPGAASVPTAHSVPTAPMHTVSMPQITVPQTVPVAPVSTVSWPASGSSAKPKHTVMETKEVSRSLPVNVVITSSDPLPTCTTAPLPVLSVTIPSKHIKGTPHNYQIPMPSNEAKGVLPQMESFQKTGNVTVASSVPDWNKSSIFKTSQPISSSVTTPSSNPSTINIRNVSSLNSSNTTVDFTGTSPNTTLNKSRTLSEKSNNSIESYDPCPDFKPIVPLPAEVQVTTGEEDETVLFSARAKLYRFVDKQWKERGLGDIKLLKHKVTGKVRVLMRRDQIHKICANHIITPEMEIKQMANENKAYFWVANDFADETVTLEMLSIRFKTADIGQEFYKIFESARKASNISTPTKDTTKEAIKSQIIEKVPNQTVPPPQPSKTVVGGFTFSSTPTFKAVTEEKDIKEEKSEITPVNVFSGFNFKTTAPTFTNLFSQSNVTVQDKPNEADKTLNSSDTVEEFEPQVEYKPVVPLPELIEQRTGEEDEEVLFEHRAKLLRFDSSSKEWKERGLGDIKVLVHKDNIEKARILMRREQVMKVCCNHSITVDMIFEKKPNTDKAVTWCAKDFSEGFLVPETFCVRFKTVKTCDDFLDAIKLSQSRIKDTSKAAKEEQNAAKQNTQTGFGDRFKPKSGSWHCKSCYTNNLASFSKCGCCEEPRPQDDKSKDSENTPKITLNWGDKFKPKTGSWECNQCFVRNDANQEKCCACNTLKDKADEDIKSATIKPVISDVNTTDNSDSWKNLFKPKEGSWACQTCYVRNESNIEECCSCGSPKDPNSLKKGTAPSIFGNSTSSVQFKFGISPLKSEENMTPTKTPIFDGTRAHEFKFGMPQTLPEKSSNVIVVSFGEQKPISQTVFGIPRMSSDGSGIINFSMKNDIDNTTVKPVKPALLPTPQPETTVASIGGNENRKFDFVFKAKSPQKEKTPTKNDKSNDSDEYASEDEGHHIHFSPIVPLPDKIEVKTGEEDEDILYSQRAKVYKFVSSEWKERGIGTVKLLKHKDTGKLRIVMRREQVLKMCLNHALTPEIVYTPKDEKTWLFAAYDFSDGELSLDQFCLRFPNKDLALKFKDAVDKARSEITDGVKDNKKEKHDEDVVFVGEIQASQEEKDRAKELMLPESFYNYKIKEPCTGCRGCQDDDQASDDNVATSAKNTEEATKQMEPVAISTPVKTSTSFNSLYATPANLKDSFNTSVFFTPNTLQSGNDSENSTFASPFNKSVTLVDPDKTETPTKIKNPLAPSKLSSNTTDTNKSLEVKPAFADTLKSGFSFQAPATSLFSFKSDNQADTAKVSEVTSLFGGDSVQKPINYFSGTQGSLFGPAGNNKPKSEEVIVNKPPIFGNLAQENSVWKFNASTDQKKPDVTATTNVDQKINNVNKDSDRAPDALLKVDDNLSFAALSSATSEFNIEKKVDFKWDGAGQQLFTVRQKTDEVGGGEEANTSGGPEEYDPHYDPIVPLPDKIVVTTGEEDEEKVFGERCKLFRYDDKNREWKERGVGEVKVLYHPQRKTYRLLLRREQVHKAVLNMLLFADLELLPMKNTDRAWTWVGTNFAENPAGEQETLALRFKSLELATKFRDTVVQCVRKLQAAAAQAIREKEQAPKMNAQETIAPLRLPKHLMDSPRADDAMKSKVEQQIAAATSPKLVTVFSFQPANAAAPSKSDFNITEQENKQNGATQKQSYSQYRQESDARVDSDDDRDTEDGDDDQEEEYPDYDLNRDYDLYEEDDESNAYYTCSGHAVVRETGGATQECPEAQVQVLFDQEYSAPKILVTDANTGEILVDMLIYTDTEFQMVDKMCSWSGIDYTRNDPVDKSVTVTFDDIDTALQFYDSCETSKASTTYTDQDA